MDEQDNDTNKPSDIISPDKPDEEASSSVEAEAQEEPKEVSGVPDVPDSEAPTPEEEKPTEPSETPESSTPVDPSNKPVASEETPKALPGSSDAAAASVPTIPEEPAEDTSPVSTPPEPVATAPAKNKLMMVVMVVVVVVLLAGAAIAWALYGNKKSTPPSTTATTTSSSTTHSNVNTWTGKANTYDWNTAANWSLGVPTSNQNLVINDSAVKQQSSGVVVTFNNNVPNLTIGKLTISGTGVGFNISGNPLTVTEGIVNSVAQAHGSTTTPQVQFLNSITFSGNQTIQNGSNDNLFFSGTSTSATVSIGASTVQFSAAKSSDIEFFTPIVGSGTLAVPASTATTGNVDFNTASPNFTGKVTINSGATIGMGNQNSNGVGVSSTDAFGTATITIASGGYLELNEITSNTFTIPNDITVGGNGGVSPSKGNGDNTGAISACITKAQQGCDVGATVTFTGKVTLTGDTTFGAFYGKTSPQAPPSTTATYVVKTLVTNNHTLTAVTNSKAVVQLPKS